MANSVLNYIINVVKKGSGDKQTVTALQSVKSAMGAIGVAAGVATAAYVAYDRVIGESVRTTVKYADEVRKLSSVTKKSAEETSRLIQVADDYKVSSDQLLTATKRLATQGYAMSIDTLAKLSDEYKGLATAQGKQQFLTKNFGKTGQDYITLLEAGGDALLANAAAQNKNLILTEKQIQAARKLEIAQDDLADAQQAYSIAIGNIFIPLQTKVINKVVESSEAWSNMGAQWEEINYLLSKKFNPVMYETETRLRNANQGLTEADIAAQKLATGSIPGLIDASEDLKDALGGIQDGGAEMAYAMVQASLALDGTLGPDDVQKLLDFRLEMGLLTQEEYDAAQRALDLKGAIEGLPVEKQIDISVYYHTYGFFPGQLLSNNSAQKMDIYSESGDKTTPYKPPAEKEKAKNGKLAMGGYPAGWTVVGEHGKELIDPGGMVHSNAESRRLIAAGVTPFRGLASGGNIGFSEPGDVFNPTVKKTGIASLKTLSQFVASGGSFTAMADAARGGSSGVSASASAVQSAVVTQQAAEVNIAAAQSVASSSQSIQESNVKAVSATQIQTAVNTQQNNAMLSELRGLRNDIKSIIPKAIGDAYQKVIGA